MMFGAVVFTSCSNSQTTETSQTQSAIQEKQQEQSIDFENAFIVDVRSPQEFASGHFEGAINIPVNAVESQLKEFEGHKQIVVYCKSGARSGRAKNILESQGHSNIINAVNQDNLNKLKQQK